MSPQHVRDATTVTLLSQVFHREFCLDEGITQELKPQVLCIYFLAWLHAHLEELDRASFGHDLPEAEVEAAWQLIEDLVESPVGPERLRRTWPLIVLADRPAPTHPMKSARFLLVIDYEDGTKYVAQSSAYAAFNPGAAFGDAHLAAKVVEVMQDTLDDVAKDGLDGLHAQGEPYPSEEAYEVMMGLVLKHKDTVRSDLIPDLMKYFRMTQFFVRPPLPPEARAALALARAARPPDP